MIRLLTDPGRASPGRFAAWRGAAVKPASQWHSARSAKDSHGSLPAATVSAEMGFSHSSLRTARRLVAREAELAGLSNGRRGDLILAVDELTTNSVIHGGGHGHLSVWRTETTIVCEVHDKGHISDPMAGLRPPSPDQLSGRGLWVVRCLCDHVQIASSPGRTAVRVQVSAR